MGGWLHVAVAFIKWRASDVTTGWNDKIDQLKVLFYERAEILTDNDTAFQSSLLKAFLDVTEL